MNILLTSAGRRTYLVNYFKQALKGEGLIYASNSVMTYTLTQADGFVITPNIYNDNYIGFLIHFCKAHDISVIIPLFDIDLAVLAKNKEVFKKEGIFVVVADYKSIQICNDKWLTYQFLSDLGLPQPYTALRIDEAKSMLSAGRLSFPLILKPRWGMGSIGIYKVYNEAELDVLYNRLHSEIFQTYLKYESKEDQSSCILIQQVVEGQEFGIEVLNDFSCNYVTTFAKRKMAMRSGETDVAEIVDSQDFQESSILIADSLRHLGLLDLDCIKSSTGQIWIIDMNCRFGGQYPFTHNAGVDVPSQMIKWLKGDGTDLSLLHPLVGTVSCKDINPVRFIGSQSMD